MRLDRRTMLGGLLTGAAAALAPAGSRAEDKDPPPAASVEAIEVNAKPIAHFDRRQPDTTRFGPLEFRGGLVLTSASSDFGGWSGLVMAPDGMLLGLFPVDTYHNIVHLIIGAIGVATYMQKGLAPKPFCQIFGVVYVVLAILGYFLADGMLGPIHLGGADVWLHAVVGLLLCYYGFVHKEM